MIISIVLHINRIIYEKERLPARFSRLTARLQQLPAERSPKTPHNSSKAGHSRLPDTTTPLHDEHYPNPLTLMIKCLDKRSPELFVKKVVFPHCVLYLL